LAVLAAGEGWVAGDELVELGADLLSGLAWHGVYAEPGAGEGVPEPVDAGGDGLFAGYRGLACSGGGAAGEECG
jgi:hypothetical protein